MNEEDFSGRKIIREAIALLYYICCFSSSSVEELSGSLFLESSLLPVCQLGLVFGELCCTEPDVILDTSQEHVFSSVS